jgi:hypothetical protein
MRTRKNRDWCPRVDDRFVTDAREAFMQSLEINP